MGQQQSEKRQKGMERKNQLGVKTGRESNPGSSTRYPGFNLTLGKTCHICEPHIREPEDGIFPTNRIVVRAKHLTYLGLTKDFIRIRILLPPSLSKIFFSNKDIFSKLLMSTKTKNKVQRIIILFLIYFKVRSKYLLHPNQSQFLLSVFFFPSEKTYLITLYFISQLYSVSLP